MTTAEKIRVALRAAAGPLTFAQLKAVEPAANMGAVWAQVRSGVIAVAGETGSSTYTMAREPRTAKLTPAQKLVAAAKRRERERARYHTLPKRDRSSSRISAGPARTWQVPIAPPSSARPKPERAPESVEQWMARTGKQPERLAPHDISTPFRHIGKAA